MRSRFNTLIRDAHLKSTKYMWHYPCSSWFNMHDAVHKGHSQQTLVHLSVGKRHLAKALHAIEDSYSPSRVLRDEKEKGTNSVCILLGKLCRS
jgi:hypothetical protein